MITRGYSTYNVWRGVKARCLNPNSVAYSRYGGRGIKICDRWQDSFSNFLADMGDKPIGLTLDRIDNDGDYTPENCRWATRKEQANNTTRNRKITINGTTKTLARWIDASGLKISTVHQRYYSYGWPIEKALNTKVRVL